MSDFAQHGLIATLQRLNESHLSKIETELVELARHRPIVLILPCHARDLTQPALAHILEELQGAKWVSQVIASLNGFAPELAETVQTIFCRLPQPTHILWNDEAAPNPESPVSGKGANIHAAVRYASKQAGARIVATQDCDVASFRRVDLARLCYAAAHPQLDYQFAKAYYSRATDRLYGRVSRLFVQPLLHAILRVAGHQPLVDFLLSFRYPLAGEVAMKGEVAEQLPASSGWGVEIANLCHVFRSIDPRKICQVEGGGSYDHKHQPAASALAGMASEIGREIFAQLEMEGVTCDRAFHSAVVAAYSREAEHAVERSASLALINALPFDAEAEKAIVATFAEKLRQLSVPLVRSES